MAHLIEIIEIIKKIKENNPYPNDIFTEPTPEEYIKVQKLFKDAGLIQDKFFGAYGRKVWNNCINMIEQLIREKEMEEVEMVNLKQITAWICDGCKKVFIDEDEAATHSCKEEQTVNKKSEIEENDLINIHDRNCDKII